MAKPKRLTVALDGESADLLMQMAGGARKQGEFLEKLIRAEAARSITYIPPEMPLRLGLSKLTRRAQNAAIVQEMVNAIVDSALDWDDVIERGVGSITLKYANHAYQGKTVDLPFIPPAKPAPPPVQQPEADQSSAA